jgi:hypothetical protein
MDTAVTVALITAGGAVIAAIIPHLLKKAVIEGLPIGQV